MADIDRTHMNKAIELAEACQPRDPKRIPRVGAVIEIGGKVFFGQRGEEDHAEKEALARVKAAGWENLLPDATVYTTLEPCTRHVRRKARESCTDRLIDAKVKRVVIGILDPNQGVCGRGLLELQRHNIEVSLFPHELAERIRIINQEFINAQQDLGVTIISPTPKQEFEAVSQGGGHPIAPFKLVGEFINPPGQDIKIIVKRGGEWWPQRAEFRQISNSNRWEAELGLGAIGEQEIHVVRVSDLGAILINFREKVIENNTTLRNILREHGIAQSVIAQLPPEWVGIAMPALPKGIDSQEHVTVIVKRRT